MAGLPEEQYDLRSASLPDRLLTLPPSIFNVAYWQNLAGLAGVLFFAFFAIVIGAISKRILPSVTGSAAITALLMAYVYPAFAILMGVLFVAALGLTALVVYYDSQSPAYSGGW